MDDTLKQSIERLKDAKEILVQFETKEKAVEYILKETGISKDECSAIYDILIKMNLKKK